MDVLFHCLQCEQTVRGVLSAIVLLSCYPYFCYFYLWLFTLQNDPLISPSTKDSAKIEKLKFSLCFICGFSRCFLINSSFCKFIIITIGHKNRFYTKFFQFSQSCLFSLYWVQNAKGFILLSFKPLPPCEKRLIIRIFF